MKTNTDSNGLIVVGVDGSEGAKAALRFALDEARLRRATLRVVHTWQFGYIGVSGIEGLSPVVGADLGDLRRTAEVALDAVLHEVAPTADGSWNAVSSRVLRPPCSSTSRARPTSWSSGHAGTAASPGCCSARSASSAPTTPPVQL
jgi:hypothetical protein